MMVMWWVMWICEFVIYELSLLIFMSWTLHNEKEKFVHTSECVSENIWGCGGCEWSVNEIFFHIISICWKVSKEMKNEKKKREKEVTFLRLKSHYHFHIIFITTTSLSSPPTHHHHFHNIFTFTLSPLPIHHYSYFSSSHNYHTITS